MRADLLTVHPVGRASAERAAVTAPVVAGIDSAQASGIAILAGHRLVKHGTVQIAGWADVERVADRLATYAPTLVAIEDVYIRQNDKTGLVLARLTGRWEQALQSRGIRTELVLASEWQTEILHVAHRARRAERKLAARAFVLEKFGVSVGEDPADAICLAVWASHHGALTASGGSVRPAPRSAASGVRPAATAGESGQLWPLLEPTP